MVQQALLLIDLQNDFMPGGALAVPQGDEVVAIANQLQDCFNLVIATQDWHPENHSSFHTLWPPHCVQHSVGATLSSQLEKTNINKIIYKGMNPDIDSYSAFFDNQHLQKTELDEYLRSKNITEIHVLGLATDYCVKFSVLDALSLGYKVNVIIDACRGIDLQTGDIQKAIEEMQRAGAKIIQSAHVLQGKSLGQSQIKA